MAVRNESCTNEAKNSCCYTCPKQEKCEISCDFLTAENKSNQAKIDLATRIDPEIAKCKESIEKLTVFFAEGKIGEDSYLRSVRSLEGRISRLENVKKNPDSFDSQQYLSELDEDEVQSVEKPSAAWYLVPLLFGFLGGIIGYIGTKDKDEDMAFGLLIFGILWSVFWIILTWTWWTSIFA